MATYYKILKQFEWRIIHNQVKNHKKFYEKNYFKILK